ncbi:ROK family protein [Clostridium sp.]|uniref:ROK family protein n=1 Tax=Clostridium sp. TaxID=1506 RepID=UPI0028515A60|nr:ROK family protein [Clostridium sp.]MDR3595394.1 ROK family protein [Clostridium sp.]
MKLLEAYKEFESLDDRCKYIFSIMQKSGPVAKSELINITKIKLTTLNRNLQILIDKKMIVETDIGESTGGRKPSLYDVNQSGVYIIGIDISRTYTRIVITNLKLKIIEEELIGREYKIEKISEIIPAYIKKLCMKSQIQKSSIVGIGIGIVGGFNIQPLYDSLSKELNAPICIDNGANAAVIGEYHYGIGKDKKNIAYVNCGVGIRTGIISSGVLIRTINNLEDAFGHMIVNANGDLCSCGNYGCIESYVSISNITKKFISKIKENTALDINKEVENIDYKDVCSLAERKNEVAVDIIRNSAFYMGIGLSNYMKLFNPELIMLSGPLIQHSKLFYDTTKKIAFEKCHIINSKIQFTNSGYYKDKSIAVGGCAMVMQKLLK